MSQSQPLTPAELERLLAGPAASPPPGVLPNFVDPVNCAPGLNAMFAVFLVISTLTVTMRLYTRWSLVRSLVVEDYLIVLAWAAEVVESSVSLIPPKYGIGYHMWDVRLSDFLQSLYWTNVVAIIYPVVVTLIKTALLLQILRIFAPVRQLNRRLFYSCWCLIIASILFYTTIAILDIVQCLPREKIWNPFMAGGRCLSTSAIYEATGIFNIFSDFAILLIPLPDIYYLQISHKKKLLTMFVFAAGAIACVASIVRTYYTWRIYESPDMTWNIGIMGIWTWVEIIVGIVVFCLPVIPKFLPLAKDRVYYSLKSRFGTSSQRSIYSDAADHGIRFQKTPKGMATQILDDISANGTQHTHEGSTTHFTQSQISHDGDDVELKTLDSP